ncbi:uncharacterized protein LOC106659710 [Trichogramma pretiosum]|uniref:uncharacterized protein LOC106659710 n=1 Tax=Trichogramma pretiosum TaxID=7493 RepID=UPI000C719422|nr:uncharacterized protein LOC106659710 [Trichogramma pretiosum]
MTDSKKSRRQEDAPPKIKKRKARFVEKFIEQDDWSDEDLEAFIVNEFDFNVDDVNWIFKTTLECKSCPYYIVQVLMENGTELQVLNDSGQTAIHIAAKNRKWSVLDLLFDYSGNENLSDNEGFTYLHAACMADNVEVVQKFIDQGVNINLTFYKNDHIESPLSLCIKHKSCELLELLLDNGADLNLLDDWVEDPLMCFKRIRERSNESCLWKIIAKHHFKELFKNKKDSGILENRSDVEGFTYLHAACMTGNFKMVKKFIDQKDDLDIIWHLSDGTSETPLTLATEFKRIKIVELLLKSGANPHVKPLRKNPLHVFFKFVEYSPVEQNLLELLIHYNCDVNEKDHDGRSPLFFWFAPQKSSEYYRPVYKDVELVTKLLKYGCDPNTKDNNGDSPLQLAVMNSNVDMVEVLLEHGADVKSVDLSRLNCEHDWNYDDKVIKFFVILHFLDRKGYQMNESSCLTALKYLAVLIRYDSEICSTANLKNTITFGKLLLNDVKNSSDDRFKNDDMKYDIADLLYICLQTIETGNMFMTEEMKNCLLQLQQFYIIDEIYIDDYIDSIPQEIEYIKNLVIKDGVSLLDVCASSPKKAYGLLNDFKFWTKINSKDFKDNCSIINEIITGYIEKCFMKKIFMDIGLEYIILLTQGRLPLSCCEKLIQYLNNEDILLVCEALINEI